MIFLGILVLALGIGVNANYIHSTLIDSFLSISAASVSQNSYCCVNAVFLKMMYSGYHLVSSGGIGWGTSDEHGMMAAGFGYIDSSVGPFAVISFNDQNVTLQTKTIIGFSMCGSCAQYWDVEILAKFRLPCFLINFDIQDTSFNYLHNGLFDLNVGFGGYEESLYPVVGYSNLNGWKKMYVGALGEFYNLYIVGKLYLDPCSYPTFGISLNWTF